MASKNFPPLQADGFNRVAIQGSVFIGPASEGSKVTGTSGNGFTAEKIAGDTGVYEVKTIDPFFDVESVVAWGETELTATILSSKAIGRKADGTAFFWVEIWVQNGTTQAFQPTDPDTFTFCFSMILKNTGINSK